MNYIISMLYCQYWFYLIFTVLTHDGRPGLFLPHLLLYKNTTISYNLMQEEMIMNMKAGHTISQIRQVSNRIFERILSERKIDAFNGAQGRILYVLWQEEQISLREVADRTGLAATTLTSMIDRMEAAGLVRRTAAPDDRRKTLLALTEKARELQPDYMAVSAQMNSIFYKGFSEEEIRLCETMLVRIHDNLKQHDQMFQNTKKQQKPEKDVRG